jgi:citrate synthase
MGFGCRVFRGNQPRAVVMQRALSAMGPGVGRLAFDERLEAAVAAAIGRVAPGRTLPPKVAITAALLLDAVGIPRHAFTLVLAVGRSAGWPAHAMQQHQRRHAAAPAHAMQQQRSGRMIRPTSR